MYEAGALIASRYRLISRVAIGGMGEVWVAEDEALHRKVATKLVKPEHVADPLFHERLLAEARAAAAVHNAHVVDVYDVGSETSANGDNLSYISMELLSGQSFVELMRQGPLAPDEVVDMLAQVGDALAAAHDRGVVHRDVKPANLMRDATGRVTVLDFGIARAVDAAALTAAGQMMGTARYISPEQVKGEQATGASDVYSLGVVAYECVSGSPPFDAASDVATALAHRDDPPPPIPGDPPLALAALIEACLAKDPATRPSAAELAEVARSLGSVQAPTGAATAILTVPAATDAPAPTSADAPETAPVPVVPPGPPLPAWLEWRRVGIVAGITGVVILAATLIGLASSSDSTALRHAAAKSSPAAKTSSTKTHPQGVSVRADRYLGLTYATAAQRLTRHGLVPIVAGNSVDPNALVVGVSPTGRVRPGDRVTLTVAKPEHHAPPAPKIKAPHEHKDKPVPPGHEKHGEAGH